MKLPRLIHFTRTATALLVTSIALFGAVRINAQTVFLATGVSGSVAGVSSNVSATGLLYNNPGPTDGNITALTFGNSFTMAPSGPTGGAFDNTFIMSGTISGDPIAGGTTFGLGYNFTLARDLVAIPGAVTFSVRISDSVNTAYQQVVMGTFTSASATFTGIGEYTFTSGVSAGATFLAAINVSYFGNNPMAPPIITGTMMDTGYGQQGITLNASAIPEPSTYAAIAGAMALGLVMLRRRVVRK